MTDLPTFLDALTDSLAGAAGYNSLDQEAPAAVLWPDGAHEWSAIIPAVRERIPVLVHGAYAPANQTGPAAWLRCMLAHALPESTPGQAVPLIYLPGVSARRLNALEQETGDLRLFAELRHRSALWVRRDGHDWTVASFLAAPEQGLDVAVAANPETHAALLRALPALAYKPADWLRERAPWKARDFEDVMGYHVAQPEPALDELIKRGESARLEFKSTARWDVQKNLKSGVIEQIIVKTIAAFLNSHDGGTLLIGVRDDGAICGIEPDYQTWSKPEDRGPDKYELWLLGALLLRQFGNQFAPYLTVAFQRLEGHTVCQVSAAPAPWPAYVVDGNDERLYVRTGNQTQALKLSEAVAYMKSRWG